MYTNSACKIINNGHFSESIPLLRGVKQGCPLSPYLLAIEILAIKIRSNVNVKDFEINGINTKVSMHVDDTNFPLSPYPSTLQALMTDLAFFSKLSGLKPNYDKCTLLRIGPLKGTHFTVPCSLPIRWTDGPVDVLGIHIPKNMNDLTNINFRNRINKVHKILQPWQGQYLTIYLKITTDQVPIYPFTYVLAISRGSIF